MWRLYSTSGYAIAIVSTYSRLAECLPTDFQHTDDHRGPYLGLVKYADHHQDAFPTGNIFHAIMHKRSSFAHEQECRAVVWRLGPEHLRQSGETLTDQVLDTFPVGIRVPVPLESLVERVIVSPTAPTWFSDSVEDLTRVYGFSFPLDASSLTLSPYL
jgi:hypothetical protein